jgi:hypothetical protein
MRRRHFVQQCHSGLRLEGQRGLCVKGGINNAMLSSIAYDDAVLLLIVHFVLLCYLNAQQTIWGMAWPYQCRCCHHCCITAVRLIRSRGVAAHSSSSKHPFSRSIVASQPARTSMVADVHGYVTIRSANKCREPLQTTPIASPLCTAFLGSRASRAFHPPLSALPPAIAPTLPSLTS